MTALTDPVATTERDSRARLPISGSGIGAVLAPVLLGVVALAVWEGLVRTLDISPRTLPAPSAIWEQIRLYHDTIWAGMQVTGRNALVGLVGGAIVGIAGAVVSSSVRVIDRMAVPIVAALSVVPIVAIAPVLYTMFGSGLDTARMIVAGLAVSVPVYLNTLHGLRQVSLVHRDLMTSYAAGPVQMARAVTLPTATPYVFTGLRIGSSLAVISALVSEYFGGPLEGLARLITTALSGSRFALSYSYVAGAIVLGLVFYVATLIVELWFSRHRGRS